MTVLEDSDAHRYEAVDGTGEVAGFVQYADHRGTRVLFHTEVADDLEGQGIGSTLAREALDRALAGELPVRVTCPFLTEWIDRHPDYRGKVTLG